MPRASFQGELLSVRRNPWVLAGVMAPLLAVFVLGIFSTVFSPVLVFVILVGALILGGVWLSELAVAKRSRLVAADATGITVGEQRIPRARVAAGFVKPVAGAPRVLLRIRWGLPMELEAKSTAEARALLHALGLDASQAVADFTTPSWLLGNPSVTFAAGVGLALLAMTTQAASRQIAHSPEPGFLFFLAAFLVLAVIPTRLRVGADGIETRWLKSRRFIAHDEIVDVARYRRSWGRSKTEGLRVTLRSGETVDVPIQRGGWGNSEKLGLVEERMREAKEARGAGDVAVDAAMLERRGRAVGEWVAALRAIGSGANVTLRTAPLPRDRLLRIVEDTTVSASARAAAAVAVGADLDDEGRARRRVAAEATAATRLRVSIERAATGAEEQELAEALAEVDAEDEEKRRLS